MRDYILDPSFDPSNPQPRPKINLNVTWVLESNVTDVVGFNVCLTQTSGSPLNAGSVKASVFLENPAARQHTFSGLNPGEYLAWVQTVVRGGDSKWMSSSAFSLPDDGLPTVRGTDDRNVQAFCEDFRSTSLPTGITTPGAAYNLTASSGKMRLQPNEDFTDASVLWDVEAWIDAYLAPEAKKNGTPVVIFRLKVDSTIVASFDGFWVRVKDSSGSVSEMWINVVRDGEYHDYRIPFPITITLAGSNSATVELDFGLNTFDGFGTGYLWLDAVALGYDNFDMSLDGNVDKGITSWNQFDSDPTGGGYFLVSPIRQPTDDDGSQIVMDENGIFWLQNESGQLITRTPYKKAIVGTIRQPSAGSTIGWGTSTDISPALSAPVAANKARMIIETLGGTLLNSAPGYHPVRLYAEVGGLNSSGFKLNAAVLEGGTLGKVTKTIEGLGSTTQAKEDMTMVASGAYANAGDAFYVATDDGSPFLANRHFLRAVLWIKVQFAEAKKANGSHYWAQLSFNFIQGRFTPGTPPTVGSADGSTGFTMRVMTDGKAWLYPIVIGNQYSDGSGSRGLYNRQDFLTRWVSITRETGFAASPTVVKLSKIEWEYLDTSSAAGQIFQLGSQNMKFTYLEEF